MEQKKKFALNGLALKILGGVFTLIGAIGMAFLPDGVAQTAVQVVGYVSLPIFAFLAAEGFLHTENLERYIVTVLVTAVISEPFYDYACNGVWLDYGSANGQNMLFGVGVGLLQLFFLRYAGTGSAKSVVLTVLMLLASISWAFVLNICCGIYFVLSMALFYLLRERKAIYNAAITAISFPVYLVPALGLLPVSRYSGERGDYNKYIFYGLYPAMWMVLALIKLILK